MSRNRNFQLEAGQKCRQTGQKATENLAILSVRLASERSGLNGFEIIRATSDGKSATGIEWSSEAASAVEVVSGGAHCNPSVGGLA